MKNIFIKFFSLQQNIHAFAIYYINQNSLNIKGLKMSSKHILIFILFAVTTNCFSQITTITPKVKKDSIVEVQKYDSLESFNYGNAMLHAGQTLYIKGSEYAKENGFYYYFFTQPIDKVEYTYKPFPRKKDQRIVSNYSELVGKYYKVESVESKESIGGLTKIYWLKLIGDDNIPFYLEFTDLSASRNFVTLGYYEKMKQLFIGKEFYFTAGTLKAVDTEKKITPPNKTKFKCIDIAVKLGDNSMPYAVLENSTYGKVEGEIIKGQKLHMFISVSAYNAYIKKYGATYGNWVAQGIVKIGMTKNMVRDAMGFPDHVNTSQGSYGVHDQWVYGKQYLYFQNGKLTSMQL